MKIPFESLEEQTLNNLIESFVLREGTDYGADEVSLSEKVAQVKQQLCAGEAIIEYSPMLESVNIKQP
jgi:uncharacterized protein YheU (UPF0270 family)